MSHARWVLRQWRELPPLPWTFRSRAWWLLALAALEQRSGDEIAAGRCREEARHHFVALADAPGSPTWPARRAALSRR